jgi:hypothetical protein
VPGSGAREGGLFELEYDNLKARHFRDILGDLAYQMQLLSAPLTCTVVTSLVGFRILGSINRCP